MHDVRFILAGGGTESADGCACMVSMLAVCCREHGLGVSEAGTAVVVTDQVLVCDAATERARAIVLCVGMKGEDVTAVVRQGWGDVVEAETDSDPAEVLGVIAARLKRWAQVDTALAQPGIAGALVGRSPAWVRVLREVAESAMFSQAPVLLTGPTGTGKELLARLVHTLDGRMLKGELVVVDCTTLARELAGSELFGHERGAFTGAAGERDGAIALADQGTLFLDEVGELSLDHQAQLLRVLQERAYRRVGGTTWRRSAFRLVCATNRDLRMECQGGRFRADLYHRIAAMTCRTPALHARREDIPLLAAHFVAHIAGQAGGPCPTIGASLLAHLCRRRYEGNVRELSQRVRACLLRHAGVGPLTLASLPEDEWSMGVKQDGATQGAGEVGDAWSQTSLEALVRGALAAGVGLKELGRSVEACAVRVAMEDAPSLAAAASALGVTPRALHLRKAAARGQGEKTEDQRETEAQAGEQQPSWGRGEQDGAAHRANGRA
jgi:transcriptional regulator with GAF, ATPase, and Fis domain